MSRSHQVAQRLFLLPICTFPLPNFQETKTECKSFKSESVACSTTDPLFQSLMNASIRVRWLRAELVQQLSSREKRVIAAFLDCMVSGYIATGQFLSYYLILTYRSRRHGSFFSEYVDTKHHQWRRIYISYCPSHVSNTICIW